MIYFQFCHKILSSMESEQRIIIKNIFANKNSIMIEIETLVT